MKNCAEGILKHGFPVYYEVHGGLKFSVIYANFKPLNPAMKPNPIPVIAAWLLLSFSAAAQNDSPYDLLLRSGSFIPEKNITSERIAQFNSSATRLSGKTFAIIQFDAIPTQQERAQLDLSGIELLDYIPNNAYTVTISGSLSQELLIQTKARAVIEVSAKQKMQPELAKGIYPSWAMNAAGFIDVWISFPKSFSAESVKQELRNKNIEIISDQYKIYRILALRMPLHLLNELASLPCVEFIQAAPAKDKNLNYNSMFAARANILKASFANGGRNLNGQGVTIGVGDDGDIQTHLDFTNRLINRAGDIPRAHASHVAGTVGGAGIIQELFAGYAPKSTLIGQLYSNILKYAPAYVQDHGMVITNNSFGSVANDCAFNGLYDLTSRILDLQAFDLPELQHVFAAGNDGNKTCSPYPLGFKNVLGGYQSAKNVITVGSTDYKRDLSAFSSKGPVRDGRLKPEIMSMGQFEASTWVNNLYSYNNGTSMAAPGVSGGLALLIQRYRQLHSGANPKSALLKTLLCNGGDDRGNTGPDFSYGFGSMNLLRSLKMMEDVTYFNTSITQGSTITQTISVPANTAQLKVLLYWNDPAAAVMANKSLVNDLDLQVDSSGTIILPLRLDTLPVFVNNSAIRNPDHYNNIEQVVIKNPAAGNYILKVLGTLIAQNPSQEYFLAYDIIPQSLVLTNPVGGERLVPFSVLPDPLYIQWDSYSDEVNNFTVEFSSDNGSNWSTLSNSIPAASRYYSWNLPNITTDVARIRLSKNNTSFTQTSLPFVISGVPDVTLDPVQCEGYIRINWTAVAGATDYEVMMLQGDEMVPVTTTSLLTYTFSGLSKDSTYWVTARARLNGNPGRRDAAVSRQPSDGSCAGDISDNDLKADMIVSPASSGRLFTSTVLSNNVPITIRIKNLDNIVSSGNINVSYSINGGMPVSEIITTPVADIPGGNSIDHTFGTNADLSAAGTYSIQVIATKGSDTVTANNSITKIFKQLVNQPITVDSIPWIDNLETVAVQTVNKPQMGLTGRDRYDFVNSTANGRLRTFLNTGIAYSGTKAITMDLSLYDVAGNTDSLTGTFNLGTFTTTDEIRLDFRYKNHNQKTNPANKLWIRGSDADTWIPMYDLFANQAPADGSYKLSESLQLNDSLFAHGQTFTSSFQARWGQWGRFMAADNESGAGYTFDDLRIYRAIDDLQLMSIDAPPVLSCGFSNAEPVTVTLRNTSSGSISNIPIVLRVDGSIVATEMISVPIAANSSTNYLFAPGTADLSAPGIHTIEVWISYPFDNVRDNDTVRITVNSLPSINTYPYLQDFEANNGYWYTDAGSSWQYGTPNSPKVRRAASGTNAWKTNLIGYYNDNELSYLYSPCFDLSSMTIPTLSLSLSLDIEDCGASLCDAAWVEYSNDGGNSWNKLGAFGQGTNWYNRNYSGNHVWSQQDYTRWHVATTALPTSNNSNIRFRFVFNSDPGVSKDGIGVDDIHIYDNTNGIYDGVTMGAPVTQTINGNDGWINFIQSGKLVASVNSPVAMGLTNAQAYINTGPVRISGEQYYHDRNITIKPAIINLADSATVRFYFLDTETETLLSATGCGHCFKPAMAYELGVTKYSDVDDNKENGTLADNTPGNYLFIPSPNTRIIPFDKGYYAEYKVKNFSEFWLNNGGFDRNTALPLQLLSFTARKQTGNNVLAEWTTLNEVNVDHFEIELAKGNPAYQQNLFIKIGEVRAIGNTTTEKYYSFMDQEADKTGVRYYRLRIIDRDGKVSYSPIRPVVFSNDIIWHVYPNPSEGLFQFNFQANEGTLVQLKIYDPAGRMVKQTQAVATGFEQKIHIDLQDASYSSGLYLLEASAGDQQRSFRIIKQ